MLARMIVALALVLSAAACGKKQAPKAPATEVETKEPLPESDGDNDGDTGADDEAPGGTLRGDPCDGGE